MFIFAAFIGEFYLEWTVIVIIIIFFLEEGFG
jgi:hypothetical protein